MASVQIPNLPAVTSVAGAEQFEVVQAGTSMKATASQFLAYFAQAFGAGTVSSITATDGLSGGLITTTGTIGISATGVSAATYGSASQVSTMTVNARGQITAASNTTISIPASAINTAIPNASLAYSTVTFGTTTVALGATSLTLGGLTSVAVTQDPTTALQLTTKQYVDGVASGQTVHTPVSYASTTAYTATYANGVSGVGATLTNSGALAAFSIDGASPAGGGTVRVLIKNQAAPAQNGVYVVTTAGSGAVAWVLTRATDYDTVGTGSSRMDASAYVLVTAGTANISSSWVQTSTVAVIGTDAVTFSQYSVVNSYTAGTGLTLGGAQFSVTNTGVAAATYGSASTSAAIAVNAQGQITSATDTAIAISAAAVTSGTLAVARGGTGITSLGTGVATWLGTPSSANLAAAVTDETGTGSLVFSASPTFTGTVTIPTASSSDSSTKAASTAFAHSLQGYLLPETYGAVGNGSTDDSVAIQAAITAAQANGKIVLLTSVSGYAISTGLSVTNYVAIEGSTPLARLIPAAGITAITVTTTNSVRFRNFGIDYPSSANAGTAAILITTSGASENAGSVIENLHIGSPYEGIKVVKGSYFTFANNVIQGVVANGMNIANTYVGDSGDSTVYGNTIGGFDASSTSGIYWQSGGGIKIFGNKINVFINGITVALAAGVETTGMYITANSIEGISGSAIYMARQSTTGYLIAPVINSNELIGSFGIRIPTDASGTWVYSLMASGNTFQGLNGTACAYLDMDNVQSFNVTNVSIVVGGGGGSVQPFITRSGADRGIVGMAIGNSATVASSIASTNTTTISPT